MRKCGSTPFIKHLEFLDLSGDNPARACTEALLRDLGKRGPILMYTSYERGMLKGLAEMVSDTNL